MLSKEELNLLTLATIKLLKDAADKDSKPKPNLNPTIKIKKNPN